MKYDRISDGWCYDIVQADIKSAKISARATPEQKRTVKKLIRQYGYSNESEYVLTCCLKGTGEKLISGYKEHLLDNSNPGLIKARVTEQEKYSIVSRFKKSGMSNFSRFVRNCCLDNPIIVIDDLKDLSTELHRIGNNLNQITLLCHQGMITTPDITETTEILKKIYKEVSDIKLRNRLKR
jgi:hypothetical protein